MLFTAEEEDAAVFDHDSPSPPPSTPAVVGPGLSLGAGTVRPAASVYVHVLEV